MTDPVNSTDIATPGPMMAGKKGLIMGVANDRSIAWGIARVLAGQGAQLAFTYQGDAFGRRAIPLAESVGSDLLFACDVTNDNEIDQCFSDLGTHWDGLDGIIHSIAFAPREALSGDYLESVNREAFHTAHDISSYSFSALAKAALPLMQDRNAALLT